MYFFLNFIPICTVTKYFKFQGHESLTALLSMANTKKVKNWKKNTWLSKITEQRVMFNVNG